MVLSVLLGVSTTNEPILVLILQPVACSMREVTVQNLRAQACKEQQQTEERQERTYKQTENQAANRQRDGNDDVNDDVGGVVVQRDCATMART